MAGDLECARTPRLVKGGRLHSIAHGGERVSELVPEYREKFVLRAIPAAASAVAATGRGLPGIFRLPRRLREPRRPRQLAKAARLPVTCCRAPLRGAPTRRSQRGVPVGPDA